MPGKNKTSLREIQVADKSIEASLQLLVEKAVKSFKEESVAVLLPACHGRGHNFLPAR